MENNNYTLAATGLQKMRLAQILSIVATVLTLIGGLAAVGLAGAAIAGSGGMALGAAGIAGLMVIGAAVLFIIAFVMELMGLSKTAPVHSGYKTALNLVVLSILVALANGLLGATIPVIGTVASIAAPILAFLKVYFVINATIALLQEKGDEATAAKGATVRTIYLVCTVIALVTLLVEFVPALATIALIALAVSNIASIVALFMYIGFLGNSVQTLNS